MEVSIIIPVYNTAKYLHRCLESCIIQTGVDLEIICVNDGSTDHSLSILEDYAKKDERIRVISQSNKGLPATRMVGILASTADYVFHLDSDDYLVSDCLRAMLDKAVLSSADIVCGEYQIHLEYSEGTEQMAYSDEIDCSGRAYVLDILCGGRFNIWGRLIRRSLYSIGEIRLPSQISIAEDFVHLVQLSYFAKKVTCLRGIVVYGYALHETSMSKSSRDGELVDRSIFAVLYVSNFLINNGIDDITKKYLRAYIKNFLLTYLKSQYPVSLRYHEYSMLCDIMVKIESLSSFSDYIVRAGIIIPRIAKLIVKLIAKLRRI